MGAIPALELAAEQAVLAAFAAVGGAGGMGEDGLGGGEHRGAVAGQAVEGAGGGQALDLPPVEQPRIDALGEIVEAGERPPRLALLDQRLHRLLADALQRAERVARPCSSLDGKVGAAGVDVGRQQVEAGAADVLGEQGELVGLGHVEAHRRGEEFGRVVRLQPGGLVGDQRVAGGMALVEAIAGELVDQVEQLVGLGRDRCRWRRSRR